jgi:hypothetical protein
MTAAKTIAPTISEPLSWTAICERYPDQFVCVVDIQWTHPRDFEFRAARVVGHGKIRREPLEQASAWWDRYPSIGFYSTRESAPATDAPGDLTFVEIPDGMPLIYSKQDGIEP